LWGAWACAGHTTLPPSLRPGLFWACLEPAGKANKYGSFPGISTNAAGVNNHKLFDLSTLNLLPGWTGLQCPLALHMPSAPATSCSKTLMMLPNSLAPLAAGRSTPSVLQRPREPHPAAACTCLSSLTVVFLSHHLEPPVLPNTTFPGSCRPLACCNLNDFLTRQLRRPGDVMVLCCFRLIPPSPTPGSCDVECLQFCVCTPAALCVCARSPFSYVLGPHRTFPSPSLRTEPIDHRVHDFPLCIQPLFETTPPCRIWTPVNPPQAILLNSPTVRDGEPSAG
jgi:hypothetical protein